MRKTVLLTLMLLLASTLTFADNVRSTKRGFGENSLGYVADLQALAKGCSWWYNWGVTPPSAIASYMGADNVIEYVPMAWTTNYDASALRTYYKAHPQDKFLLGFNEPNFKAQANLTPTQAAQAWPALESLADELGLSLVAPALNYPDGAINDGVTYQPTEWMDAFIAAYKNLYGKEPRLDYLALHSYMNTPSAVIGYVENFAKKYGKKVWLTEFCSWEGTVTADQQESTMIEKLKLLEKSDYVYRYAWFKARGSDSAPYYNLVEYPNKTKGITAGTLTSVGFSYLNMSRFDGTYYYNVNEKIPVAQFVDEENLTHLQKSYDPQCADSVELALNAAKISTTYQVNIPEAGTYTLIARASRIASASDNLAARISVKDGDGNVLSSRNSFLASATDTTYVALQIPLTLPAGKQKLTIYKENLNPCYLSMLKLVKTVDANDADLVTKEVTKTKSGSSTGGGTGGGTGGSTGGNTSTNDNIKVTDAATAPFKFSKDEMYYGIYLDETTRKANLTSDQYVNMGDNGGTQNSYVWSNTMTYGDATEANSFGVTGNYLDLIVGNVGWSGMGYNVNAATGTLNLSGINNDYSLHMALKSTSADPVDLYFLDGAGHTANLVLGSSWMVIDGNKHLPIANFARDGKWHNIDIPMSYLKSKFGLCFGSDTDHDGNLFCINAGANAGTEIAYDAIFFHGPKSSVADTAAGDYDVSVTSASDKPFSFSKDDRYYIVYLDGNTKSDNLTEDQIVDCGPNGTNRQLYIWSNTYKMNTPTDDNSFGVGGAYMDATVLSVGWSGLGYCVNGSSSPLNMTGIDDDYKLHFAVKSTYTGPIEFELIDGFGNAGWIVLGTTAFEGHAPIADFTRDGKWYNIDVPIKNLENRYGTNFSTTTNLTGNLFCMLAGGTANTEVGYDAVFIHGPKTSKVVTSDVTLDDREITITKASDNAFTFPKDNDYYVVYLDGSTQSANIPNDHYFNIGPNGTTQFLYPWESTVTAQTVTDDNSFGVGSAYMSWIVGSKGWSGLGYFITPGTGVDLSGITSEYTLHFAVKSSSTDDYHYTVYDGNGKAAHLNLGTQVADGINPIGNFTRDGNWYAIDVPVSYLVKQGLDFSTATNFNVGNIFTVTGPTTAGALIDYDAVFFYGPAKKSTGINAVEVTGNANAHTATYGIYDMTGRKVQSMTGRGLYIVKSAEGTKKILVR
jgi:predicted small secreted protein